MNKIVYILLIVLCTGCYLTSYTPDPIYEDHPHTTEVYYYGTDVYFGYHSGFYYYYGVPHFYPWWYYYQFIPPYHFHTHTHVYVQCDNGNYVYGHRGPTVNNNVVRDFKPNVKPKNNIDKSFVFPNNWKSSNSTRITKNTKINYNTNKINYNRNFNTTKHNNKSNSRSNNRSNKTRKPR